MHLYNKGELHVMSQEIFLSFKVILCQAVTDDWEEIPLRRDISAIWYQFAFKDTHKY